jgi:hypothetical protein
MNSGKTQIQQERTELAAGVCDDRQETVEFNGRTYRVQDLPPRLAALLCSRADLGGSSQQGSDRSNWSDWSDWSSDWSDNIVKNITYLGVQTVLEPAGRSYEKQVTYPTPQPVVCNEDVGH